MLDALIAGMVVAGRYRLESRFASGAWGSLWHAHDDVTHLSCTVRLADAGVADLRAARERFEREVQAAESLRCENVVNVIDHGEWSGMPFIVFEALQGEDLAKRLSRERRLPPSEVLEIVSDVAHALTRAHDLGIVHRDLKPENIFLIRVGSNEVAKVLDFGIAGGKAGAALDRTTKVGHHMGLPYYTSPEQAAGKPVDFRADLWALGAIAFHCLTGRPPFESESLDELLTQLASAPVPRLNELDPDLPASLDAWRENALSRDPELRFQSAEELSDALAHGFQRSTLTGHPSPDYRTRRANRSDSNPDLTWLAGVPDASTRASDNLSEAPMSEQRAYFRAGSAARKRVLRVSVGAVFGLMLVTLGVSLIRKDAAPTSLAEANLTKPKPALVRERPAPAKPAEAEAAVAAAVAVEPKADPAAPTVEPVVAEAAPATPPAEAFAPCQAPAAKGLEAAPVRAIKPKALADDAASTRTTRKAELRRSATTSTGEPDYGI